MKRNQRMFVFVLKRSLQNIQCDTQNIQRALTGNYFLFVFTSEPRIDHEGFESQH